MVLLSLMANTVYDVAIVGSCGFIVIPACSLSDEYLRENSGRSLSSSCGYAREVRFLCPSRSLVRCTWVRCSFLLLTAIGSWKALSLHTRAQSDGFKFRLRGGSTAIQLFPRRRDLKSDGKLLTLPEGQVS